MLREASSQPLRRDQRRRRLAAAALAAGRRQQLRREVVHRIRLHDDVRDACPGILPRRKAAFRCDPALVQTCRAGQAAKSTWSALTSAMLVPCGVRRDAFLRTDACGAAFVLGGGKGCMVVMVHLQSVH